MIYMSDDDWYEFLLIDSNLCLKYMKRGWQMHQLWESRNDGECFTLRKILIAFPDKFREYYGMNITTFHYILDSMKDDTQGYSNSRNCIEAEQKFTVALWYIVIIMVRIKINYICKMLHAIITQRNLKGNYTRKSRSYTIMKNTADLQT
jgi:hypothetical protein